MSLKKMFFTSDWHIGHAKSIEYDRRPFRDVDHMNEVLINNYNSTVTSDGVCYFLGDIGLGNTSALKEVIDRLHGVKVCVLGNHDKNMSAMYAAGFDIVVYGAVLYVAGERVTMSHCPLVGLFREDTSKMRSGQGENWHGESRHHRYSFTNEGQFHLHGHIHSGPFTDKEKILDKQFDVGVPANNYRPVSYPTIESWIARYKLAKEKVDDGADQ